MGLIQHVTRLIDGTFGGDHVATPLLVENGNAPLACVDVLLADRLVGDQYVAVARQIRRVDAPILLDKLRQLIPPFGIDAGDGDFVRCERLHDVRVLVGGLHVPVQKAVIHPALRGNTAVFKRHGGSVLGRVGMRCDEMSGLVIEVAVKLPTHPGDQSFQDVLAVQINARGGHVEPLVQLRKFKHFRLQIDNWCLETVAIEILLLAETRAHVCCEDAVGCVRCVCREWVTVCGDGQQGRNNGL